MNIVSVLTELVKPAIDAVFRWKEGADKMEITRNEFDVMKTKLDADIQLRLAEEMRKPDSEFRAFMLDYEGKAEDQTPLMRNLRSSVRPIITYWALIVISAVMFGMVDGAILEKNLNSIPEPLWNIFLAIFGFWFGGRAIMQVAESWKTGDVRKVEAEQRGQVEIKRLDVQTQAANSAPANTPTPAPASEASKPFKFPWDDQPW